MCIWRVKGVVVRDWEKRKNQGEKEHTSEGFVEETLH